MNLALKDTRYHLFKFSSSTIGISLLLMVVFALGGIIRGVILDSSTIVSGTAADLWVVQKGWLGPFVESSRLPEDYYRAIQSLHGVFKPFGYVAVNIYIPHNPVGEAARHGCIRVVNDEGKGFCSRRHTGDVQCRTHLTALAGVFYRDHPVI